MSVAYEIAKVAVPVGTAIAAIGAYVAILRKAGTLRAKDPLTGGPAGGGFAYVPDNCGHGHPCHHGGHGGHGHFGGHHGGDCGGGHHGGDGGGGHH